MIVSITFQPFHHAVEMDKDDKESSNHIAYKLLSRSHPQELAERLFKERVVERPLILRPTEINNARSERRRKREEKAAAQKRKSRKPKPLSAKQKRALCIYDIPREQQKYAIYEPLHEMWCSYIREVLGISAESSNASAARENQGTNLSLQVAGPKLVSADFHGALLEVTRSRCVSRVGVKGIVVKDTKFTFELISPTNMLKSQFLIELQWHRFILVNPKSYSNSKRLLYISIKGAIVRQKGRRVRRSAASGL